MPPLPEASISLLLEIDGISIPMLWGGGRSINDCTCDACGGGGGGLVDEESHDTCEWEGGGGGGGRWMDGAAIDTSGMGGGGRIRRVGRSVNGASSDACGGEWEDVDHPPKAWYGRES